MYVSNPFFISKIQLLPEIWLNILFWTLLIIYIVDNIVSGIVIRYVKKTEKIVGKDLDNTEEITKKVKEVLQNKSVLHRRLLNAYPSLEAVKIKIKEKKEEIKEKVEEQREELANKVEEQKNEIENKAHEVAKRIENKTKNRKDEK